jgi:hypothetical protein
MIKDEKNLKDSPEEPVKDNVSMLVPYNGGGLIAGSYTKTNKLITALYMVTDIIDQNEPLRTKLRTLGAEIISDVYALSTTPSLSNSIQVMSKISETVSFLEIASTINLISQMNNNILKKEFIQLRKSIEESFQSKNVLDSGLSGFFKEEISSNVTEQNNQFVGPIENMSPKISARIGVQKGSTLMKAISDRASLMSNKVSTPSNINNFDVLKKERRNEIVSIIKNTPNNAGATITDIKMRAKGPLASLGEKTLQRELISMVKDSLLYKTGEKRWSRYFISK